MRTWASWTLLSLGLWAACGSDELGTRADPDQGKTFSQKITAVAGGTLKTESGSAVLTVGAAALAAATPVTVAVAAAESATAAPVYNFGPDGTTFAQPATLALKVAGVPAKDKKAVLATFADGKWAEVPGSSLAGGVVTGPVSHFSRFSVILVGAQVADGGSRVDDGSNGGCFDLSGTWTITVHCSSDYVGRTVVVSQTGCTFSGTDPVNGKDFSGTAKGNSLSGNGIPCSGTGNGATWDWTCGNCVQKLVRGT